LGKPHSSNSNSNHLKTFMTAPITQTAPAQTREKTRSDFELLLEKDVKTQVWFEPYGSNDEIKLSVPLIKRYIAVAAKDRDSGQEIQPSDEECVKFLMLCKARRLNPFEGDAFMIPFWDGRLKRHAWSLITAHSAFLKRAELHPTYDGMDSGVIVQDKDGAVIERQGDFRLNSDTLLGGWATVYQKGRAHPKVSKVKLSTYKKDFGVWMQDPEGMICKVAECQGLRDSFPTMIGGMFLREEMDHNDIPLAPSEVKRPAFNGPEPDRFTSLTASATPSPVEQQSESPKGRGKRPTLVEAPLDPPTPLAVPETAPVASPEPEKAPVATAEKPQDTIMRLVTEAGITKEQLVTFLKKDKWLKETQNALTDMSLMKLDAFLNAWRAEPSKMVGKIRLAN
jgi:phage recombination protein Bet